MLGKAGDSDSFGRVVRAVLLNVAVHDLLLGSDASAGGVQFEIDPVVFLEVLSQLLVGGEGLLLDLHVVPDGVCDVDGFQALLPALRQGVELIDQRHVVDLPRLRCQGAQGYRGEQKYGGQQQGNRFLHVWYSPF